MQEMQTLNVAPERKESASKKKSEEITIPEVERRTKIKLMDWLVFEVKLIKNNTNCDKLINDLPHYCRNGVFFSDLINRLNGKH